MLFSRNESGFFNFYIVSFLTIAILLTFFSIFYGDWYNSRITGLVEDDLPAVPPNSPIEVRTISSAPSQSVIDEVKSKADKVSENANYASSIKDTIYLNNLDEVDLIKYKDRINLLIEDAVKNYESSLKISNKYISSLEFNNYLESINKDIKEMDEIVEEINIQLTKTVSERLEEQKKYATWDLTHEKKIEEIKESLDLHTSKLIPFYTENSFDKTLSPKKSDCIVPAYLIAINENIVDLGKSGFDSITGYPCALEPLQFYERPVSLSPKPIIPVVGQGKMPENPTILQFSKKDSNDKTNFEAVILGKNKVDNLFEFVFIASPSYSNLEEDISVLINRLFYNENSAGESPLSGLSVQQTNEILNKYKSIPWILWIILAIMIISFLFFGRLLSDYERLIYFGKKALNKKDYVKAINNYNELVQFHSDNPKIKGKIFDYFRILKKDIGNNKINLEFFNKNSLPIISSNISARTFNAYSRVENMINHALYDLKKYPQLVKARIPIIVEEYKRLEPKDKELLAPHYESLVYKLKMIE